MKKPILAVLLCLGLTFTSCTKDENSKEDEISKDTELIGTWSYMAYIDEEGEEAADACESKETITFNSDNSFDYVYFGGEEECELTQDASGSWKYISENVLNLDYSHDTYEYVIDAQFEISGNVLILILDEGEGEYKEKYQKQ